MDDLFRIGIIVRPHGIKGDVKVMPVTSEPGRFMDLSEAVLIKTDGTKSMVHPDNARMQKGMVLLHLRECNDADGAEALRGSELFVTRENAIPLSEGEYYVKDLIGLKALDENMDLIGTVSDIFPTGANDVYVIKRDGGKDILVPAVAHFVREINAADGYIVFHLEDGL
jgi:16S rRNA processing protein RimM